MGGKSGGGGRTPYEAPDNLKSGQYLRAIGLISLGPIKGGINGDPTFKELFFDNTPVQNPDGSYNFPNVDVSYRLGTQDQLPLKGFDFSEREVPVNTEVKQNVETPITRYVIDPDITRIRMTMGITALFHQNEEGDTYGSNVDFEFLINNRQVASHRIEGKSSSRFFRSYILEDLPTPPFTLAVKRITPDSNSQRLQNATHWVSYTEIIDTKLSYPNMALVGLKLDSRYVSNFPNINILLHGAEIKVPSTYNPETRAYDAGIWKGDFKTAWTDNPAWHWYYLINHPLAGLGKRLSDYGLDKFALYQIAQYCDELVDDGYGGKEPRMTSNLWITEQREAYQVINDMASTFRAIAVWNGVQFTAIQDRPTDPVCVYSQSNVINGKFNRQYVAQKAIFTAVEVEYIDARNQYQKAIEYVADDVMIERYGYNVKKITAFACTSRGQARRYGEWVLATSRIEQCTITFSVGRQGLMHLPGDIIEVADNSYAGKVLGGRVIAINGRVITLDRAIEVTNGSYLSWLNNEMQLTKVRISKVDAQNASIVTLEQEPSGLAVMDNWVLKTPEVSTQLYRAIGITENDDGSYTITALQHEPQKEAIVDGSASFIPANTTVHSGGLAPVQHADISTTEHGISLVFTAPPFIGQGLKYQVKLYRNSKLFNIYSDLPEPNLAFSDLSDGNYVAEIRAKNGAGQLSEAKTVTFNVSFTLTEFVTVPKIFGIELNWKNPLFANAGSSIELWVSKDNNFQNARKLVKLAYPTNSYTYSGLSVNDRFWFWARMTDSNGAGQFTEAVEGVPSSDATQLTDYLHGKITKSELGQSLINSLQSDIDSAVAGEASVRQSAVSNVLAQVTSETRERTKALKNEADARTREIRKESNEITQALQAEARTRGTAIVQLQNVDQTQAQQISQATAKADDALAGLQTERTARIEANRAETVAREALTGRVANAESGLTSLQRTVTQQGQSIAESSQRLNAKIDGLSVGGRNLILLSKDSLDTSNITLAPGNHHRTKSFNLSKNVDWSSVRTLTLSCFIRHAANPQRISRTSGTNYYRIGAEIKVIYRDGSHQYFGCFRWGDMLSTAFDGVHNLVINIPSNKSISTVESCIIQIHQINGSPLYVSNPKLEIGNVATDWSPAPEDFENIGGVNLLIDCEYRSRLNWDQNKSHISQNMHEGRFLTRVSSTFNGHGVRGIVQGNDKRLTKVKQGETYTLSLFAHGTPDIVRHGLNYVYLMREEGGNFRLPQIPITGSVNHHSITFTSPFSSKTARILIGTLGEMGDDQWFSFHSVQLERGNIATDWSLAPDDLRTLIDGVKADITEYKSTQATANAAQAEKMTQMVARLGQSESSIQQLQSSKASKTEVASIARTALRSEWQSDAQALAESAKNQAITATDAKISTLASTVATNQEAMTASVNQLKASLGQASGANLLPNANFKKLSNNFPVGWGLYNNSGASQAASHIIVPGIDGSNAVKLTWSGVNSTTKGLYILHSNPSTFEVGQYYVLAVCARVPEGQPQDGRIALHYSNAPGWVDWRMVSQPTLSHQWQWTVMVARKPPHANGAYNQWYISVENYTGQAVELCLPYASKGETWLGYKAGDLSAEINDERQARVTSDTALSNRIDTITASVNDTKAQISSVSNVVAGVDGKVQAIHSLRTETIANGRKAIAGITLGSNGGEQSEIILMADKLQLVRNAQDGSPVPMFTVAQNRVAIRGDLIADGTVLSRHIRANQTFHSPFISGGSVNIGNGAFMVDSAGNLTANKGVFKGSLEGATGTFAGTVQAINVIGANLADFLNVVMYRGKKLRTDTTTYQVQVDVWIGGSVGYIKQWETRTSSVDIYQWTATVRIGSSPVDRWFTPDLSFRSGLGVSYSPNVAIERGTARIPKNTVITVKYVCEGHAEMNSIIGCSAIGISNNSYLTQTG